MSKLTIEVEDNDGSALIRILVDGKPVGIMTEFKLFADASDAVSVNATFADTPESMEDARKLAEFSFATVQVELMNKATLACVDNLSMCKDCGKVMSSREELCDECRVLLEQQEDVEEELQLAEQRITNG